METTNPVFNSKLYDWVSPKTLPCWMRSFLASRLAASASQWTDIFARYFSGTHTFALCHKRARAHRTHSGTYNNMWMVLHLANFKAGKALPPGFLMIMEEIPTMTRIYDATPILGFGAFTSYNIPCVTTGRRTWKNLVVDTTV
jgi:hypothetical protein